MITINLSREYENVIYLLLSQDNDKFHSVAVKVWMLLKITGKVKRKQYGNTFKHPFSVFIDCKSTFQSTNANLKKYHRKEWWRNDYTCSSTRNNECTSSNKHEQILYTLHVVDVILK